MIRAYTKEGKTWAWFTDASAQHAGTTHKWAAVAPRPLSGTSLKDMVKGNPPTEQNFEQCIWLFILLVRRSGQM